MQSVRSGDTLVLFGDGVCEQKLAEVAGCFSNVDILPSQPKAHALMLIASVDDERLARAFETPTKGCFEVVTQDEIPQDIFVQSFSTRDLAFSFSSTTVYRLPVAHHITNALFSHFELKPDLRDIIEMALHEALVNAVVHGNLEIGHIKKDTVKSLKSFDCEAENHLADPKFAARKIEVSIQCFETYVEIKVVDQGDGFSFRQDQWHGMPWRGINLIVSLASSVCAGENGEPLTMTFER